MFNGHPEIQYQVGRLWNQEASYRTVLYYAYLLSMGDGNCETMDIRTDLENTSSVQVGSFDDIVQIFVQRRIMVDENTCALSTVAWNAIQQLFVEYCGDDQKIPLDGLRIYKSKDLLNTWLNPGREKFEELFAGATDLKVYSIDDDDGKILCIERKLGEPYIAVYFMNKHRMTGVAQSRPLTDFVDEKNVKRQKEMEKHQLDATSSRLGLRSIRILAAPTYKTNVASLYNNPNKRVYTIGPINLAFIHYHVSNITRRRASPDQIFEAFIEYMDPINGNNDAGIIFSNHICSYFSRKFVY